MTKQRTATTAAKPESKIDRVIALLKRKQGATLAEMIAGSRIPPARR